MGLCHAFYRSASGLRLGLRKSLYHQAERGEHLHGKIQLAIAPGS